MGKLRAHASKEVADLAKEVVKKWKTEVEKAKGGVKGAGGKTPCAYSFLYITLRPSLTSSSSRIARKASVTPGPATPVSAHPSKNEIRSAKSDGVSISATGDKTRDKCAELIYDGLAFDSAYRKFSRSFFFRTWLSIHTTASDLISKRAIAIEAEVVKNCNGTNQEYKAKIRSLFVNLKDKNNPGLRESVVSGDITAARFSSMSSQV